MDEPALGAHYPTPTAPSTTSTSLCFQQFGESAFRSKLTPRGQKTSHSGTLLAQGTRLLLLKGGASTSTYCSKPSWAIDRTVWQQQLAAQSRTDEQFKRRRGLSRFKPVADRFRPLAQHPSQPLAVLVVPSLLSATVTQACACCAWQRVQRICPYQL